MSSSSHPPPAQAGEVAAVHTSPSSQLQPLIATILQTSNCITGSTFLVERIEADIIATRRYRAVRLLLGDGQLCIQALLTGDLHGLVDSGMIYEGCYVRLQRFEFRTFNIEHEDGSRDKSAYLLVQALAVTGSSSAYLEILKTPMPVDENAADLEQRHGNPYAEMGLVKEGTDIDLEDAEPATHPVTDIDVKDARPTTEPEPEPLKDDITHDDVTASDDEDGFEVMDISPTKATQRRELAHWEASTASGPWQATDPLKPMKLTTLRSIPNLPYKQNWKVNVLAVVAALSDLETSHLPPHSQRTVRLADPSTTKQVLLTVFVDPAEFTPAVGSVVLLVGVKNHRFDAGCLKKYVSDKPAVGERWWYENPSVDWCNVAGLREWWDAMPAET